MIKQTTSFLARAARCFVIASFVRSSMLLLVGYVYFLPIFFVDSIVKKGKIRILQLYHHLFDYFGE